MAGKRGSSSPNGAASARGARLNGDERRRQILASARRLFSERHYGSVSLEEIAVEAGVARGLINHYFGTKRDLYVEVVRVMVKVPPPPVPDYVQGTTVEERIRESIDAWLEMIWRNRETWLDSVRTQGLGDPEIAAIFEEAREEASLRMLAVLGLGPPEEADDVQIALLRAYGGMAEAATVQWLVHERLTREQLERLLVVSATRMAEGLLGEVLAPEADR